MTLNLAALREQLDAPYSLSSEAIARYRKNGYVKLQGVLSPEV